MIEYDTFPSAISQPPKNIPMDQWRKMQVVLE